VEPRGVSAASRGTQAIVKTAGPQSGRPPYTNAPVSSLLPFGGTVVSGQAIITELSPTSLSIVQTSKNAVIDWSSFLLGSGVTVSILAPDAAATSVFEVMGSSPTTIFGNLVANDKIALANPNGIRIGPGASVTAAGFLATTATMSAPRIAGFMAGGPMVFDTPGQGTASVVNAGTINVADGGVAALVAPGVVNSGLIRARLGKVELASGSTYTIDLNGDGLVQLAVSDQVLSRALGADGKPLPAAVVNSGSILADGGRVYLSANVARNVTDNVINMSGLVQARAATVVGGDIILSGGDKGIVAVSGTLDVSGVGAGQTGGTIKVLGEQVALDAGAKLKASGDAGGGTVLVGGNVRGGGPEPHALYTFVDQAATISADALRSGNGGRIAVWSDQDTQFNGFASAQGGALSGNGGYVETSSAQILGLGSQARVTTAAPHGVMGEWLLDPNTVTIDVQGNQNLNGDTFTSPFSPGSGKDDVLGVSTLVNALNGSNITISATNGIALATAIDSSTNAAAGNLTLVSPGGISLGASVKTKGSQTYTGPVTLTSNVTLDTSTSNAAINLGGSVDGGFGLTLASGSGAATFGGIVGGTTPLASLSTTGTGPVNLNATAITTVGAQSYGGPVTLGANTSLTSTNSAIGFVSTVNGAYSLGVAAGTGSVTFGGAVGATNALSSLDLSGTTGTINLNSTAVKTTGTQTYGGAVVLGATDTLTTTNSAVNFTSTVDGGYGLTIASGSGAVTLGGAAGGTTALASLTSSGTGTVKLDSNVTTSGTQTYTGPLVLGATDTLKTTNSLITFNSTIDGGYGLTATTGSGAVTFGGIVGGATTLASLSTTGTGSVNFYGTGISTSGLQDYNGAVSLLANTALTTSNSNINFHRDVSGSKSLAVSAGNAAVTFYATVGNVTPLSSLDMSGTTGTIYLQSTQYKTSGAQIYGGQVWVDNNLTMTTTNSPVTFVQPVYGYRSGKSLTITAGSGTVTFDSTVGVGASSVISGLNLSGTTGNIYLSGGVSVTNAGQKYGGPVVLLADVAMNSSNSVITFNNTVDGAFNLSIGQGSGALTFGGVVGGTAPLASLTTTGSGTTNLNSASVTTTGLQSYGGPVSLGTATVTLDSSTASGSISLGGQTTGNSHALVLNSGNGNLALSGVNGTSSLTLDGWNGTTNLNWTSAGTLTLYGGTYNPVAGSAYTFPSVTTNGSLTLSQNTTFGALTLGGTTTLDGSTGNHNITFSSTVDNAALATNSLTVNAGSGAVNFNAAVGQTNQLSSLTVNANSATFTSAMKGNGTFTLAPGTAATAMHVNDGTSSGLYVNGTEFANFSGWTGGMVFGSTTETGGVNVGATNWSNAVKFQSAATGAINLLGSQIDNSSGASMEFNGPVVVKANTTVYTALAPIYFDSTVDDSAAGSHTLTLTAFLGIHANVTFSGIVGGTAKLAALDLSGTTNNIYLNSTGVTTSGSQIYGGNVVLGGAEVLTSTSGSGTIQFNTMYGAQALKVSAGSGTVNFNGTVGSGTALTSLDLSGSTGPINLNTTSITSSGQQTYGGAVTGATNTSFVLSGGGITLNSGASISATGSGNATVVTSAAFTDNNNSVGGGFAVGSGRWLIYSQNPANDVLGGLTYSFKQYNTAYPTAPP